MLFKRLSRSSSQQRDTTGFLQTCLTESGGFLPREALCRCSRGFAPEPREWGPQLRPDPPTVTGTRARAPLGTEPAPPRPPRARIVPGRATKGKPDHLNPGVLFPPPGEILPSGARKQKSKKTNGAVGRGQTEPGRGGGGGRAAAAGTALPRRRGTSSGAPPGGTAPAGPGWTQGRPERNLKSVLQQMLCNKSTF